MRDIFMYLLQNLTTAFGDLKECDLSSSGKWASMTIETETGTYAVSIRKEEDEKNA